MTRWLWVGLLLSLMTSPARADKPEAVALRRQGDTLARAGRASEAEAAYRKAVAVDPGYREGYGALSTHYLRAGEFEKAVTLLEGVVKAMPDYAEGWYNLAYALRKRGRLDAAVAAYRRYAALRPQSPDPHFGIGLALQAKGDHKAAAASFRRYAQLENDPTKRGWVERALKLAVELEGKGLRAAAAPPAAKPPARPASAPARPSEDAVIDPYAEAGTTGPAPARPAPPERDTPERRRARPLKEEGDRLLRAGRLEQAADRYRQAIALDYTYVAALNELGNVLFTLKRYSDAIQVFRVAIRDNPSYSLGWYNLAYALRKAGRVLEAVAAYRKFIQLEPRDADPHYGLGLAYLALGQKTEAASAFKEYIRLERRPAQERWVHKAQVELAKLEGRAPPPFVPGSTLTPSAPAEEARPKTKAELRAEAKRKAVEERKARLEVARAAAEEKKRQAAEARKRKAEEAKAARLAAAEAKKQKAEEAKAARLAAAEAKKQKGAGETAAPPAAGATETATGTASLPPLPKGVTPAADTIESPPMPPPPGPVPATESGKLRVQADTLARAGKCVSAAPLYKRATELDPFDLAAYDGVAHCAFKLGAYRPGAAQIAIALRDNPEYARGWLYLARLERAGGQGERAVGAYRKLLRKQPNHADAHFELARTLKSLGQGSAAVEAYRDYLRLERRPGTEAARAAAILELRALGGELPALAAAPPPVSAHKLPAPAAGVAEHGTEKSPAALKAEARRQAALERKAQAEASRAEQAEKQRLRAEARKQAAAEKRARLEAARAEAEEKRRAAREAAEAKRQAAKRKREEARLALLAKRKGAGKKGKDAHGAEDATAVAEAVGKDVGETAPSPEPPATHDVLKAAPDAAKGLLAVADAQFAKQRYDVALGIYQQASRLDPSATEPLYKAGVAAVALRQMHLAADLFARVVQLDPGNATALTNLRMAQNAARATRPSPKYLESATAEVESALDAGRYAAALHQLDKLLAIESSARRHLLRALACLGLRQPQRAIQDAGRALALDPGQLDAYRAMGDAHRQLGKKEKAVYYYRLYLARTPADSGKRAEVERAITELQ